MYNLFILLSESTSINSIALESKIHNFGALVVKIVRCGDWLAVEFLLCYKTVSADNSF